MPTGRDVGTRVGGRVTYAPDTDRGRRAALREHEAATAVGLATGWRDDLPVRFPHAGGVVRPTKHSSTRWSCCTVSSRICCAAGGRVVTGVRVQHVSVIGRPTVRWDGGRMSSDTIVLATGSPTVDRALHFARLEPHRSYALALGHPDAPDLMLLSAHGSSRSVRDAPGDGAARRLLVGGEGHTVGRARHDQGHLDRLRDLHPPRWGARGERCRPDLRLPTPRVPRRPDRGGPRGTRHPSPGPARRRSFLKHP